MACDPKSSLTRLLIFCALLMVQEANAATIQLPQTGQTKCYDAAGSEITCRGSGQDGDKLAGAVWPNPRFTDNANGTVTDNLTGLIWLKNANCFNKQAWTNALASANTLANGSCDLSDGSAPGTWRLPNVDELESLVDEGRSNPALPATQPFTGTQSSSYWSSTDTGEIWGDGARYSWSVDMNYGGVAIRARGGYPGDVGALLYVWPVRGGK